MNITKNQTSVSDKLILGMERRTKNFYALYRDPEHQKVFMLEVEGYVYPVSAFAFYGQSQGNCIQGNIDSFNGALIFYKCDPAKFQDRNFSSFALFTSQGECCFSPELLDFRFRCIFFVDQHRLENTLLVFHLQFSRDGDSEDANVSISTDPAIVNLWGQEYKKLLKNSLNETSTSPERSIQNEQGKLLF